MSVLISVSSKSYAKDERIATFNTRMRKFLDWIAYMLGETGRWATRTPFKQVFRQLLQSAYSNDRK